MDIALLVKGLVIGFSIAAPVGPIGVLCIRRTLAEGRLSGLLSGLGAATADAVYDCRLWFDYHCQLLNSPTELVELIRRMFSVLFGSKNLAG